MTRPKKEKTNNKNIPEERPWGHFEVILDCSNHKIKKLYIKKGCCLSLQSHEQRNEYWIVVSGFGRVQLDDMERHLGVGGHILVPKKQKHRIWAAVDMELIEIQMGVCDEKDIIRYEDDYGRI